MDTLIAAMLLVGVITFGAVTTGAGAELCAAIGGTYRPDLAGQGDICPGGRWRNLIAAPAPAK
jgi:hypothetical protein